MNMTDEEIRIKIAESLGLEVIHDARGPMDTRPSPYTLKRKVFYTPTAAAIRRKNWPRSTTVPVIPNYPESLDACVEFESTMSPRQRSFYRKELAAVCLRELGQHWSDSPIHATARQRCLAYLKTKGLIP